MSRRHISTAVRMVLFIMATIALLIFVQLQINKVVDCNQIILNDHWTVIMDGETREDVDLSKMFFSDVDRGETIEIAGLRYFWMVKNLKAITKKIMRRAICLETELYGLVYLRTTGEKP